MNSFKEFRNMTDNLSDGILFIDNKREITEIST